MSQNDDILPESPFDNDEKVFAYDVSHQQYYDAFIKKCHYQNNAWQFLVHYKGWNSRYDTWLSSDVLYKDTPEHQEMVQKHRAIKEKEREEAQQQELSMAMMMTKTANPSRNNSARKRRAPGASGGSTFDSNSIENRSDHNHRDGDVQEFDHPWNLEREERPVKVKRLSTGTATLSSTGVPNQQLLDACELPFTLRTILVDEFEQITRKQSRILPPPLLHVLPAHVTVQKVVAHFATQRQEPQFATGLLQLFDTVLPRLLLYPQERSQYRQLLQEHPSKPASELFSCEFLLRLLVKLPVLLVAEPIHQQEYLCPLLRGLILLLQKNRSSCFKGKYLLSASPGATE